MVDFSQATDEGPTPPPSGWAAHEQAGTAQDAFAQLAAAFAAVIPSELLASVAQAVRNLLAALRALLEWLIGRFARRVNDAPAPQARDIPVS